MRDRLPQLSGYAAHFLLLWIGRRQPVWLSGRQGQGSPTHIPTRGGAALASWDISGFVPGRWVTSFTQDPPMPRTGLPSTRANLSLPSVQMGSLRLAWWAQGDVGRIHIRAPGPQESGCVTGQAFRENLSHHSLLIFMTCINEIVF